MPVPQPRSAAEETARCGEEIYERTMRTQVEGKHDGEVVAIDVGSGLYPIADNALTTSERLLAEHPDADIWRLRVGHRALYRLGGGARQTTA